MIDIDRLLENSAELHDAVVLQAHFDLTNKSIRLEIDDLNINFKGLPEYQGHVSGMIKFNELRNLIVDLELTAKLSIIYSLVISKIGPDLNKFEISFWPSGQIKGECISIECLTSVQEQ